ncbi:MAG TPA: malate synthase A [Thermoleophilaceae bacterium]|nr:malate synthase A [Thermoleophilaceae bacterium]
MSIDIEAPVEHRYDEVLTGDALALVGRLHDELDGTRRSLLEARQERQASFDEGATPDFVAAPEDFTVAPVPEALLDRRVEITGPTSRKMVINALNSGARGFMADFEDSNSPYWSNMVGGQVNLADAIRRTIEHDEKGKHYELGEETAVLLVRPRGLHLPERHLRVKPNRSPSAEPTARAQRGGEVAGAFMDFGLYVHRNAEELLERGAGPYFYIPKLESAREARLWRDAFVIAEETLGLDRGTIKATVLIETVPAAFEMDAILYELRDHSAGLNAGRWDYIFSTIKRFRSRPDFVLPDRSRVTMTVPFMRAYTELLVKTCHARGAHAMGGMAAVIPSRTDQEANRKAFEAVRADKEREAGDGFDGTWVAHPDSVEVAMEAFDAVLGDRPNQVDRQRDDVSVDAEDILSVAMTPGEVTERGLRSNVNVGIQYLSSWLRGNGAAGIYGLMEDAATAEISRAQVWQWIRHGETLDDGRPVTPDLVRKLAESELEKIRAEIGDDEWFEKEGRPDLSRALFERVALSGDEFVEFLTLPAYEELLKLEG